MKWVTRARPKIDRIACPWLIARHIDAQAEFLYVPTEQAVIVRGADTDRHELAPQCAGALRCTPRRAETQRLRAHGPG